MRVAGQTKVEQHHAAIRAQQQVGGLEVEVANVLGMQALQGLGGGHADTDQLFHANRRALGLLDIQPLLQALTRDMFHHQIGQVEEVATGHQARHVGALQHLQHLQLDLEAHDVLGPIARGHAGHFHHHGKW